MANSKFIILLSLFYILHTIECAVPKDLPEQSIPHLTGVESEKPDNKSTTTSSTTRTTTTTATTPKTPSPKPTTTPATTTSTIIPPSPTNSPSTTTTKPTPTPTPDKHDRSFDLPSFIGGIILSLGLTAIGYVFYKFYKTHTDPNYRSL